MQNIKAKATGVLKKYFSGDSMNYKEIIAIFIPLWVDQAFVTILNMLNTAMISSSGSDAVSAVSMVDSLNLFLLNIFIAVATGGTVLVAQYKGADSDDMVSKSASQAVVAVTLLALSMSAVLLILNQPILAMLFGKAEHAVLDNARIYLIANFLSYPFFAVSQSISSVLRGSGDSKSSLLITVITSSSYVLLNLVLVTIFKMGVMGLSLSLNTARLIGMVFAIIYLLRFSRGLTLTLKDFLHINRPMLKRIFVVGIPFAAEQLFFNGGKILTQTFIVGLGTAAMQINALCASINSLFQFTVNAIGLAAITVIGQCMGRRDIKDARKFSKSFIAAGTVAFVLAAVILLPLFPLIIRLYSPPAAIVPDVFTIIIIVAVAQIFLWTCSFVIPYILRAAGDSTFTTTASLLTMWLFRVIMGYILGVVLPFGIIGVWCAMVLEWGIRSVIYLLRLRGDKWYRHHLIE